MHVSGELAMIVQCSWGAACNNRIYDPAEWNGMVLRINSLLAMTASVSHGERMRRYILVVSKFPHKFQFLERTDGQWEVLPQVETWDAVHDYLRRSQ
jgi:hypothetical protein